MNLISYFPYSVFIPISLIVSTNWFFYLFLKIKNGSLKDLYLGALSLICFPIGSVLLFWFLYQKFLTCFGGYLPNESGVFQLQSLFATWYFLIPFLVSLFLSIRVLKLKNKLGSKSQPLSKKSKTYLIIVFLITFLPAFGIFGYYYFRPLFADCNYQQIENSTNFHVYKPKKLMSKKLTYGSGFTKKTTKLGKNNFIQFVLKEAYCNPSGHKRVSVSQAKAWDEFDLFDYVQADSSLDVKITTIEINYAVNSKGYIAKKNLTYELYFLMPDNVLVKMASSSLAIDELIEIANNLE